MRLSKLLGERYKEKPAEATMPSHIFLLRGGYMRQVAAGIYTLLPPAKRIVEKIENIIREEMDAIGGQEVLFPVVMPAELWEESGRYQSIGSEMARFNDRGGHRMVLGMTHEEASVHLARSEANSYAKYPFMIYQIQTKFRDEPRCRGGLIRVREFIMKDAYSFHTSKEDLTRYYDMCHGAYERIFARAGLKNVVSVRSDTGMMGGSVAHEFMLLSDYGEDSLALCPLCGYRANVEVAAVKASHENRAKGELKKVSTPDTKTIEDLSKLFSLPESRFVKACVFAVEGRTRPLIVFLRGDYEVNEAKLRRLAKANVFPLSEYLGSDICFGYIGPVGFEADAEVYFDTSLEGENDMVCGANQEGSHLSGVNSGEHFAPDVYYDIAKAREGGACPVCGAGLTIKRGIEVGNIFQLGTKYSESMGMAYADQSGERKVPFMGCYGIGVGRLLACVCEEHHDDFGPIWPVSVAPWQIHICALGGGRDPEVKKVAEELYVSLSKRYEVLFDDRDLSAGVTFADADLLGVPLRVVVGKRGLEGGQVEISARDKSFKVMAPLADVDGKIDRLIGVLRENS
jgi:prolyl-tRNA synthetase